MRQLLKWIRALKWVKTNERGFTLAELLVVVGIVVGLAAVILPNVGRFTGEGQRGALATELASIQTAIDAYASDPDNADIVAATSYTNELIGGSQIDLDGYLRLPNNATLTDDNYCWDDDGTVWQESTSGTTCP